MNPKDITNKEIQYNIMIALMQISGHLSDMVEQGTITDYVEGGDLLDLAGISK